MFRLSSLVHLVTAMTLVCTGLSMLVSPIAAGTELRVPDSAVVTAAGPPKLECADFLKQVTYAVQQHFGTDGGAFRPRAACRSLSDVALPFANPESAEQELQALGWQESAVLWCCKGSLVVHRFSSPANAARALHLFGSLENQPPGTNYELLEFFDDLPPNERWLDAGVYWGSLIVQRDDLLFVLIEQICCWGDAPGPRYPEIAADWEGLSTYLDEPSSEELTYVYAPEQDQYQESLETARHCLEYGILACAKNNFEDAYTISPYGEAKAELADFYVITGDSWQRSGHLDRAREAYERALQIDSNKIAASMRLSELTDYDSVELFDSMTEFRHGSRGCVRDEHALESLCGNYPQFSAQLAVTEKRPDPAIVRWDHTPNTTSYAVAADVEAIAPTSAVGLLLNNTAGDDGVAFMVDPLRMIWWIDERSSEGEVTALIGPHALPIPSEEPIQRLEVRVLNGTPEFLLNGNALGQAGELAVVVIPSYGNTGIVLTRSTEAPVGSVVATFDSFGIYGLKSGVERAAALADVLPEARDLGPTWRTVDEGSRAEAEITETFSDPEDASRRFADWDWQENAYREYFDAETDATLQISVHEFRDEQAATQAVQYFADERATLLRLVPAPDKEYGRIVRALTGETAGRQEASIYLLNGASVIRVTATSEDESSLQIAQSAANRSIVFHGDRID